MSPRLNPQIFPALFEAHVQNHRAKMNALRGEAARKGERFDPLEHEQILIGIRQDNMQPDWVPLRAFLSHGLILGRPGSGKTALLAAIVSQIIRSGACTAVVVSSKSEPTLFQGIREECYYTGRRLRWATNRIGLESFAYNALSQSYIPWRSVNQRVQPLLKAFGLDYGERYGGSWFTSSMENFLNNLITYYGTSIYSFLDLARHCSDPNLYTNAEKKLGPKEDWSNSRHVHHEILRLAGWEPGQVKRSSKGYPPAVFENAIDVAELFSEPQVVFLHLTSIGEDITSRNLAKLMLYGSLEIADIISTARQKGEDVRSNPVIFIFDEFAPLVSSTFLPALAQARSLGLGCLMGLQTLHQLSLGDKDYTDTFIAETCYKHLLSAPDIATQKYVVETSGEIEQLTASYRQDVPKGLNAIHPSLLSPRHASSLPFLDPEVHVQSRTVPRLTVDDVMRYGAEKFSSLRSLAENFGESKDNGRWVPLHGGYHIDRATYERRDHEPFPQGTPGTLLVRPFSEHDLRFKTVKPSLPIQRPGQGGPTSVNDILRRMQENDDAE